MKFRVMIYAACILIIGLLQTTVLDAIKIFNVKPNLTLVFIVCVALLRSPVEACIVGFFSGLAFDSLSGGLLGFHTLLGMYMALLVSAVTKRLYRENLIVVVFFSFIATVLYEFTACLLDAIGGKLELLYSIQAIILPEAVYNGIFSIFVFMIVVRMSERFEDISKASRRY